MDVTAWQADGKASGKCACVKLGTLSTQNDGARDAAHIPITNNTKEDVGGEKKLNQQIQSLSNHNNFKIPDFKVDISKYCMSSCFLKSFFCVLVLMTLITVKEQNSQPNDLSKGKQHKAYVKSHPAIFAFQSLGAVVGLASVITLPVLGAVGFSAAGPVAGSLATAWHSSIGLVQAGSLFAWCQSATMGGAAAGSLMGPGLTGLAVGGLATVAGNIKK